MSRIVAIATLALIGAVVVWQLTADNRPEAAPVLEVLDAPESDATVNGTDPTAAPAPLPILRPVPDLVDIEGWMNTEHVTFEDNQGVVTVVQFWTFGCFNCKNTLDNLRGLYEAYHDDGLEIIGVHAPEFAYEADPDNIAAALIDLDVTWPVALDTEKTNFRSWQEGTRSFWPRTYVIDHKGNIRYDHIGEGKYDELNGTVARLLAEAA